MGGVCCTCGAFLSASVVGRGVAAVVLTGIAKPTSATAWPGSTCDYLLEPQKPNNCCTEQGLAGTTGCQSCQLPHPTCSLAPLSLNPCRGDAQAPWVASTLGASAEDRLSRDPSRVRLAKWGMDDFQVCVLTSFACCPSLLSTLLCLLSGLS
jgi:hypothetical protein